MTLLLKILRKSFLDRTHIWVFYYAIIVADLGYPLKIPNSPNANPYPKVALNTKASSSLSKSFLNYWISFSIRLPRASSTVAIGLFVT